MFALVRRPALVAKLTSAAGPTLHLHTTHQCDYNRRSSFNERNQPPTLHYDVLGLTPKATQGEIKTAYYKLSMTYHPDKNQGSDSAALKFRQLNDAYEVLGNLAMRKRYDQGLNVNVGIRSTPVSHDDESAEDLAAKFRRSRGRAPVASGRSTIYDYDDWMKNHYGELFNRKQASYVKFSEKEERTRYMLDTRRVMKITLAMILSTLGCLGGVFLLDELHF